MSQRGLKKKKIKYISITQPEHWARVAMSPTISQHCRVCLLLILIGSVAWRGVATTCTELRFHLVPEHSRVFFFHLVALVVVRLRAAHDDTVLSNRPSGLLWRDNRTKWADRCKVLDPETQDARVFLSSRWLAANGLFFISVHEEKKNTPMKE